MAKVAASRFGGFDPQAMQFWHELATEMNREWFVANKARYEALWVTPMQALLDEVAPKLAKAYAPLKLTPPKVMRIHRDVRFSKDKTPYKLHIGGMIKLATGHVGVYLHLGMDEEFVGAGCYFFDAPQLARWRKAVLGKPGEALATIIGKLRKRGYEVGGHDDYKKVPRGFDAEHPRAELLKLRGLTAGAPTMPKGLLHEPALAGWLVEHAVAMAPLVTWLTKVVK